MMHGTKCACEEAFPVAAGCWRWLIRCRSRTCLPDTQGCRKTSWYPAERAPISTTPQPFPRRCPPVPPRGQANGGSGRFATHSVMEEDRVRLLRRSPRVWVGQPVPQVSLAAAHPVALVIVGMPPENDDGLLDEEPVGTAKWGCHTAPVDQTAVTACACGPLGPSPAVKFTRWPSSRER